MVEPVRSLRQPLLSNSKELVSYRGNSLVKARSIANSHSRCMGLGNLNCPLKCGIENVAKCF